jgi:hypothetical protein
MNRVGASLLYVALALALLGLGFWLAAGQWRHALLIYLASWLFALGVVLGSMAWLMIHALTGGEWGIRLSQSWLAAIRLFPYVAIGVGPLLIGMHQLFPWAGAQPVDDPYLDHQRWYLNATGLILRTAVLLAIWGGMVLAVLRSAAQGHALSPRLAAPGLLVMLCTVTLAAVDWVMSLVPCWHSTDIGLLYFTGQLLTAFALAMLAYWTRERRSQAEPPRLLHDFGNLLLVLVLGWAYVAFIDYLTSWVADLPAETAWYLPRLHTSWWWLGAAVACVGLAIPFFTLLLGRAKSSARVLVAIAVINVFAQWLNLVWLVLPSGVTRGFSLRWTDPLISIGLLGCYALLYRADLRPAGGAR